MEQHSRIDKINLSISELRGRIAELQKEKELIEKHILDTTGKYLCLNANGFMFVTQSLIQFDEVTLQGFYFNGSSETTPDDFFFEYHENYNWYMGVNRFKKSIQSGDIYEITEEEFKAKFKEMSIRGNELSMSIIDRCKNELNK